MAIQPAYWSKFLAHIRAHGRPERAIRDLVLPRAAVQRLLREQPHLRQEVHEQVLAYRRAVLHNVLRHGRRYPHKLQAMCQQHRWSLEEVMSWLKDFPDLHAPLTEIHARYEQYVSRQKAEAQTKVERDQQRAELQRRQRDELRQQADSTRSAASLLELEALQERLQQEAYAGADALSFTQTRKVGTGEVVAASVHKVTCKRKTTPGPASLGFNLQFTIAPDALASHVENLGQVEVEQCTACMRAPTRPAKPRRPRRSLNTNQAELWINLTDGTPIEVFLEEIQISQIEPGDDLAAKVPEGMTWVASYHEVQFGVGRSPREAVWRLLGLRLGVWDDGTVFEQRFF
ncbi:hypothetical protein [Nonomuraea aridisoli]|uniref:Uncharacterized protein n=1 Tax=Nonomuraea aridisoli TaxID=2070368 RepID=A0A2W2F4G0_9ACTN|nr:hypothetical protein [Nonomuraea aridisoli]PZG19908.1 hypothetical protein C1J01_10735 [Nonomuraea aridisoli]